MTSASGHSSNEPVELRLYVAGDSPNSRQAVTNLNRLCRDYLPDRHAIEIVDVFLEPARALTDGVVMTPMLMVLSFSPPRTIVGNLSDTGVVLRALGVDSEVS